MKSSKTVFQESAHYLSFRAILENPSFEPACQAAILGLMESLPESSADPSKAWDSYLQLVGARRVLETLSRLHEPDEKPTQERWPSLNYDAGKSKTRQ